MKFPQHLKIQHLDDVCACSPAGSDKVDKFYASYTDLCMRLGIALADPSNPDKAFAPRTEGQVLGIDYDSTNMSWFLREDKLSGILLMIREVLEEREVSLRFAKSLCGKLLPMRELVRGSRFHLAHIIMETKSNKPEDMEKMIKLSDWCCRDLEYFRVVLPVFSHRSKLQDPDRQADLHSAIQCFSDAAGGSRESLGRGVGAILVPSYSWTVVTWSRRINEGWSAYDDKSLQNKMSCWELVGVLLGLTTGGECLRGKQLVAWVDNDGSVAMFKKGWTTKCDLCNTVIVALYQLSAALDCDLYIYNIMRCSNRGAEAADALSKFDMTRFRKNMPNAKLAPESVPGTLLAWLENPLPDRLLGDRILKDMSKNMMLLNY